MTRSQVKKQHAAFKGIRNTKNKVKQKAYKNAEIATNVNVADLFATMQNIVQQFGMKKTLIRLKEIEAECTPQTENPQPRDAL